MDRDDEDRIAVTTGSLRVIGVNNQTPSVKPLNESDVLIHGEVMMMRWKLGRPTVSIIIRGIMTTTIRCGTTPT